MTRYGTLLTMALTSGMALAESPGVWTRFQDPFEKAFSLEVPQGWTVKGGLFRLGYSDERPMVDLRSPDLRTNIRLGDVAIPSYSLPTRFHSREGERYDLGEQAQMTVAAYRSGQDFARLYAQARFLGMCKSLTVETAPEPMRIKDMVAPGAGPLRSSFGEIAYRCQTDHGARLAYAYARTALYNGLWQVTTLASFLAPPEQAAAARKIVQRCAESLHLNPQWIAYQEQMDREGLAYQRLRQQDRIRVLAAQVRQFEARMQSMRNQVRAFETRQNAQADQVRSFGDTLTGLTPTVDPLTGQFRRVWTGTQSAYWTNGRGDIVNSDTVPKGGGWRQLSTPQ
jgi:hypothetical protein